MIELFFYAVGGITLTFCAMILAIGPSPWWVKRQRSYNWSGQIEVGGPCPFIRCKCCGEWIPKDTGKHGVVRTQTMAEFMEENGVKYECPKEQS